MGNKQSCCIQTSPKLTRKSEEKYIVEDPEPPAPKHASSTNLQHISEREPEGDSLILAVIYAFI